MRSHLTKRSGLWYYARRVPKEYRTLDKRGVIKLSTGIRVADDPRGVRADQEAANINRSLEGYWRELIAGRAASAQKIFEESRKTARRFGFDYASAREIATRPIDEIVDRIDKLIESKSVDKESTVIAVMGGDDDDAIPLSQIFPVYETLTQAEYKDLSVDQRHRWKAERVRAIAGLISVVGDKPLNRLTKTDALDYHDHWQERILNDGLSIKSANKAIGSISRMIRVIDRRRRLGLDMVFAGARFDNSDDNQRPAFDPKFVQDKLLKFIIDLNDDARDVVMLLADTGLRISEAVNLNASTIHLKADIPFIQVRADGRRIKTQQSKRDIPLVGVALVAMNRNPDGFIRYKDKSASLSTYVNKFFRDHKLLPTQAHSLYSLRHTFKDRLRAVEAPEEMIDYLMGHKINKPKYGAGYMMPQKQKWLLKIAFKPVATRR